MSSRFQKNADVLAKYFADVHNMDGIIIKIEVEEPYTNYVKTFGDPMQEKTLQLADEYNNTIMLYKADHRAPTCNIMKGVTVMTSYSFTKNDMVRIPMAPALIPKVLENYIFPEISQVLKTMDLSEPNVMSTDASLRSSLVTSFLNMHFTRGDMVPLSVMVRKPGWQKSFRNCVNVKVVSICQSCRKKANKNCCYEYTSANRTTALMVIGWAEK